MIDVTPVVYLVQSCWGVAVSVSVMIDLTPVLYLVQWCWGVTGICNVRDLIPVLYLIQ